MVSFTCKEVPKQVFSSVSSPAQEMCCIPKPSRSRICATWCTRTPVSILLILRYLREDSRLRMIVLVMSSFVADDVIPAGNVKNKNSLNFSLDSLFEKHLVGLSTFVTVLLGSRSARSSSSECRNITVNVGSTCWADVQRMSFFVVPNNAHDRRKVLLQNTRHIKIINDRVG